MAEFQYSSKNSVKSNAGISHMELVFKNSLSELSYSIIVREGNKSIQQTLSHCVTFRHSASHSSHHYNN